MFTDTSILLSSSARALWFHILNTPGPSTYTHTLCCHVDTPRNNSKQSAITTSRMCWYLQTCLQSQLRWWSRRPVSKSHRFSGDLYANVGTNISSRTSRCDADNRRNSQANIPSRTSWNVALDFRETIVRYRVQQEFPEVPRSLKRTRDQKLLLACCCSRSPLPFPFHRKNVHYRHPSM